MADSCEEGNTLRSIRRTWYCLIREKTDSFVTGSLPSLHQLHLSVCTLCFIYPIKSTIFTKLIPVKCCFNTP